jgi:hypothetical protein
MPIGGKKYKTEKRKVTKRERKKKEIAMKICPTHPVYGKC